MATLETNQNRILNALPGACKTLGILSCELGLTHRQVTTAASSLIRKGFVERVSAGCFQLTGEGQAAVASGIEIKSGPNAPFQDVRGPMRDTLRQRAWNAMRIHQSFTINELLLASTHGPEQDAKNNLQRYLSALVKAGVLRRMRRRVAGTRPSSNGFLRYQLLRDLGEIAPTLRAAKGVLHDHNSGEEFVL